MNFGTKLFTISWLSLALQARATDASLIPSTQIPGFDRPQKGSIGGFAAGLDWKAEGMSRGNLILRFPIDLPEAQGPLLMNPLPQYNQEQGLSEFGLGWEAQFCIERARKVGEINFVDDDFSTPFGTFTKGVDGIYYPYALTMPFRMQVETSGATIFGPDGTRYRFGDETIEKTTEGTFRFCLSSAKTVYGYSTVYRYAQNTSGRLFLDHIYWGGLSGDEAYELYFTYEQSDTPYFNDYRWGFARPLDRRVRRLELRQGASVKKLRWSINLQYEEMTPSPAFYLKEVQKIWPDESRDPPMRFQYGFWDSSRLSFHDNEAFSAVSKDIGALYLSPKATTLVDFKQSGLFGFEHHATRDWYVNRGGELVKEEKWSSSWNRACGIQGPQAGSRIFQHLRGLDQALDVINFVPRSPLAYTMHICDERGQLKQSLDLPQPAGLSMVTRFADLNRDLKPEMIVFHNGFIRVFQNQSTSDSVHFVPLSSQKIPGSFKEVEAFWVTDVNGDGRPDLMIARDYGIALAYGLRNFQFSVPVGMNTVNSAGNPLSLKEFDLTPVDINGDGLKDLLAMNGLGARLLLQSGANLVEQKSAGVNFYQGANQGRPLLGSFDLQGSLQIALADGRGSVKILNLTQSRAGLLQSFDDGKGNMISFDYSEAYPEEGVGSRQRVLAQVKKQSVGRPDTIESFSYQLPKRSLLTGRALGFSLVEARRLQDTTRVDFLLDDEQGALAKSVFELNGLFQLERSSETLYQKAVYQGIEYLRPGEIIHKIRQRTENLLVSQEHIDYEGPCRVGLQKKTSQGILSLRSELTFPEGLKDHIHCLAHKAVLEGKHDDAKLDFVAKYEWQRNAMGLATHQRLNSQLLETMDYDSLGRLIALRKPGQEASTFSYLGTSKNVLAVKSPDGVVQKITDWDENRDLTKQISTVRGKSLWSEFYGYRSNELLSEVWDSLDESSIALPKVAYDYIYPTRDDLGEIKATMLLDDRLVHEERSYLDGLGEVRTLLTQHEGWFAGLITDIRDQGLTRLQKRRTSPLPDLNIEKRLSLLEEGETLQTSFLSSLSGEVLKTEEQLQKSVSKTSVRTMRVSPTGLVKGQTEAGQFTSLRTEDGLGQVLSHQTPEGQVFQYRYDVLGRLRQVTMPSGLTQTMSYDHDGFLREVRREELGTWLYSYDHNRQLKRTQILGKDGKAVQAIDILERDGQGRMTEVKASADQDSESFRYFYDGRTAHQAEALDGQVGFLTGISGRTFHKEWTYRLDGRLLEERLFYQGGLRAQRNYSYTRQGQVATETLKIQKPGSQDRLLKKHYSYNHLNKLSQLQLNDRLAFDLHYDNLGRLEAIYLPLRGIMNVNYDELTGGMTGTRYSGSKSWNYHWTYNDRGFIQSESHSFGSESRTKAYSYSYNGYFVGSSAEQQIFDYSPDGLSTAFAKTERDSLGRLKGKGERLYRYGPQGSITGLKNKPELEWIYDEQGQLLAKEKHGQLQALFWSNGQLKSDLSWIEPLTVEGITIGYLENETFIPAFADVRGTLTEREDFELLPTAYGQQDHSGRALENYGLAGGLWDSDLGLLRFGVRHYDPDTGLFVTPDVYFIEQSDECVRSPVECNLYSYGRNNPLKYTDPTGKQSEEQQLMGGIFIDQLKTEVKGAFVAAWTTTVEIPYKIAGNLFMAFDAANLAGKDISGLASAHSILARDGIPVQSIKDGISALSHSSRKDQIISGLSLGLAPISKFVGIATVADAKHLSDLGLIGSVARERAENFGKFMDKVSNAADFASKWNDRIGASQGSLDSLQNSNYLQSDQNK